MAEQAPRLPTTTPLTASLDQRFATCREKRIRGWPVVSPRLALEVRHHGGPVPAGVQADAYRRPVEDDLRMSFSRIRSSSDQPMSSSNAFRRRGPKLFPGCTCSTTRRRLTAPLPMVLMNPTVAPGSPFLGPSVSLQRLGELLEGQSLQLIPGG